MATLRQVIANDYPGDPADSDQGVLDWLNGSVDVIGAVPRFKLDRWCVLTNAITRLEAFVSNADAEIQALATTYLDAIRRDEINLAPTPIRNHLADMVTKSMFTQGEVDGLITFATRSMPLWRSKGLRRPRHDDVRVARI